MNEKSEYEYIDIVSLIKKRPIGTVNIGMNCRLSERNQLYQFVFV